ALVAQHEREMISARTKAALAAAKARGQKLGSPKGAEHLRGRGNAEAVATIKEKADRRASDLQGILGELMASGLSLRGIADELNSRGILTPRGGKWHPTSVKRSLERVQEGGQHVG
ncbi:recombinase family protein, partial [Paramagnetospirillum marisnigri]|uniref:recombinase family protein n=1 Tax=Paramagnetospirillum marisnigri TaxID=1285242 RepID=UPI000B1CC07B